MSNIAHKATSTAGSSATTATDRREDLHRAGRVANKRFETNWTISLFGTAVGAGVLFLPINAGLGGLWPLLIVTLLIGPMTYLSHRALSRFVCASPVPGEDITVVARKTFGEGVR